MVSEWHLRIQLICMKMVGNALSNSHRFPDVNLVVTKAGSRGLDRNLQGAFPHALYTTGPWLLTAAAIDTRVHQGYQFTDRSRSPRGQYNSSIRGQHVWECNSLHDKSILCVLRYNSFWNGPCGVCGYISVADLVVQGASLTHWIIIVFLSREKQVRNMKNALTH